MSIVVIMAIVVAGIAALVVPWIGIVAAYAVAILSPQHIWWWEFGSFRPALAVTAPTLLGCVLLAMRRRVDTTLLKTPCARSLLLLLIVCALSAALAPYAAFKDASGVRHAGYLLEVQFKIILLFLVASLFASTPRALLALGWVVAGISAYLVYWANDQYLQRGWVIRLAGPSDLMGQGPYYDENNFAAFFVGTLPFLWYLAMTLKSRVLRYGLWLVIPFGWHAIFLTGSRGGLLGMAVVLIVISLQAKQRVYGLLLVVAFCLAFVWQGGSTMKERATTIANYAEEASASSRIDAWEVALSMMTSHPLTGVGPGAFIRAFPEFSDRPPLQAHNTYLQVGAEYGPLGATLLLGAIAFALMRSARVLRLVSRAESKSPEVKRMEALLNASYFSLIGLFTCSMFLTLQLFELLYLLIFASNALAMRLASALKGEQDSARTPKPSCDGDLFKLAQPAGSDRVRSQ